MKRDKLDILRDILAISSKEKVLKTHIIYRANLNSDVASRYLNWLLAHEFLIQDKKFYVITPIGSNLLFNLNKFITSEVQRVKDTPTFRSERK